MGRCAHTPDMLLPELKRTENRSSAAAMRPTGVSDGHLLCVTLVTERWNQASVPYRHGLRIGQRTGE